MNNNTFLKNISSVCLFFLLSMGSVWAQCDLPTNITITTSDQVSATVTWTASTSATLVDYETELRISNAPGSGAAGLVLAGETSNTSITYSGLMPQTTYYFYIKSRCSGNINSEFSTPVVLTTAALEAPVAINPSDITNNSFVARWEASLGATQYQIQYRLVEEEWDDATSVLTNGAVLNKLIFGLDSQLEYVYRVRARVALGAYSEWSNAINVTTTDVPVLIARFTTDGWLAQPTEDVDLYIEANYNSAINEFGTQLVGKSLTVFPGISFTVASGNFARITENIINNSTPAKFIVESNANLNQRSNTANIGAITVKRNSFPIHRLDYTMWSSPVMDQNLLAFSPQTTSSRFYSYNSSTNLFNVIPSVASTSFILGKGYLIRAPNNWIPYALDVPAQRYPGKFVGVANAAEITVPLELGLNMVGNPFPNDINASSLLSTNNNLGKTIYFWRRKNNDNEGDANTTYYATYNINGSTGIFATGQTNDDSPAATRPNGTIKVGQGFIVKQEADGGVLSMKFDVTNKRDNNYTDRFLKNGANPDDDGVERHKFYLHLTGAAGIGSEILMAYTAGQEASDGVDAGDALSFGDANVGLSYLIADESYVIQGKPLPFENTDEIALRFETSVAASYTISLADVTGVFTEDVDPILIDMLTNTETNLRNASYSFASEIGIFDARFKIVFVENYLGNNEVAVNPNAVVVASQNNVLSINAGTYTINNVDVFDIQGRKIYSKSNVDASTTSISDLRAQNQIILVQITTDHGVVTKKVQF